MTAPAITARGLLAAASAELGGDESAREVELLLGHALGKDRAWLYAHADDALAVDGALRFHALLMRRASGEPIAYIVGRREFWSLELEVDANVLIPRPETELLVELALRRIAQNVQVDIVDLGTGSGAIALAIACERPQARVLATDTSMAALAVARTNAGRLGIGNVGFAQGDWCAALDGRRYDLIVSNPPYIAQTDAHLQQGDLCFEPRAALASGADGLDAIRSIVAAAPAHLQPHGWLLFEHGHDQGSAARDLLAQNGFVETFTALDLEQRERVSGGRTPA
ncbi:MAG TPA: peptide chain release factor N(5)-glutamine methyltransferase [Rudaea sp.]|nr:peptide chain release factor N(5)-glutamine methyltransferase [Rudaea sp.]